MFQPVTLPLWLLVLILLFAAVTFASHFLFPSVRWFLRRRAERIVDELNKRLTHPIRPFKLARRTDMIQRLLYDPAVVEAVAEHAHATGVREDVAFEQAQRYAREIVPGFSASVYFGFAIRLARWLSTRLYDVKLGRDERAERAAIDPEATVIYVMNHRSNMDYVLVTYLVADQSALSYAVGEWARVWPLGPLIRALGGYFIRRRERNALYRRVLARYVQLATQGGVMQAVFPEGGLSQTGELGKPKVGLLSYLVEGFDPEGRDIVFVPVALNYDRVIEDTLLIEAHAKGERRFRGTIPSATAFVLRYVWRRIRRTVGRFGTAAVSFGQPLSLRSKGAAVDAEVLANELMQRIAQVMPVLPVPLVARVLSEAGGEADRPALSDGIEATLDEMRRSGAILLDGTSGAEAVLDTALAQLTGRRIVAVEGDRISVLPGKEVLVAYYAASISVVPDRAAVSQSCPEPA